LLPERRVRRIKRERERERERARRSRGDKSQAKKKIHFFPQIQPNGTYTWSHTESRMFLKIPTVACWLVRGVRNVRLFREETVVVETGTRFAINRVRRP
jgi:hypothetical protein